MVPIKDPGPSSHPGPSHNAPPAAPIALSVPVIQVNNDSFNAQEMPIEMPTSSNMLAVPDRVSVEYKDDDDDDPVQMGGQQSAFFSFPSKVPDVEPVQESVLILLPKNRTSLGKGIFS